MKKKIWKYFLNLIFSNFVFGPCLIIKNSFFIILKRVCPIFPPQEFIKKNYKCSIILMLLKLKQSLFLFLLLTFFIKWKYRLRLSIIFLNLLDIVRSIFLCSALAISNFAEYSFKTVSLIWSANISWFGIDTNEMSTWIPLNINWRIKIVPDVILTRLVTNEC